MLFLFVTVSGLSVAFTTLTQRFSGQGPGCFSATVKKVQFVTFNY